MVKHGYELQYRNLMVSLDSSALVKCDNLLLVIQCCECVSKTSICGTFIICHVQGSQNFKKNTILYKLLRGLQLIPAFEGISVLIFLDLIIVDSLVVIFFIINVCVYNQHVFIMRLSILKRAYIYVDNINMITETNTNN